jgi:predicted DNA-binding protein (MmcQ/YjbR family)
MSSPRPGTADGALPSVPDLHHWAWQAALRCPGARQVQPFGPQFEVFKVLNKVFMMSTTVRGEPIVTLKCEPELGVALRQEHPTISPGYHMNKRHWISLGPGPGVSSELVGELVTNAYLLVTDALTQQQRAELRREVS